MRIAYFDCFSGISGDMILGALVDAGLPLARLQEEIDKLQLDGVRLRCETVQRHGLAATRVHVELPGGPASHQDEHHLELPTGAAQPAAAPASGHGAADHAAATGPGAHGAHHSHHNLEAVRAHLTHSALEPQVQATAIQVFERLAGAEASVHGVAPEEVHLHEVGALDAIVDVVGAVAGLRRLGVEQVQSSALRLGTGLVSCAHGRYPVPAPGVVALCEGVPTEQTDIRAELVTPTGAAIITTLASTYGAAPPARQLAVGYGAGSRDLEPAPNVLRLRLLQPLEATTHDRMQLIEANIDDMNPEVYGYVFERLLEAGARDVYVTPVLMKKGRPGHLLTVLADAEHAEALMAMVLRETTTIGVRHHPVERRKLCRSARQVQTLYGPVRIKVVDDDGHVRCTPEYDDCAACARQRQVPLLDVYAAALAALAEE